MGRTDSPGGEYHLTPGPQFRVTTASDHGDTDSPAADEVDPAGGCIFEDGQIAPAQHRCRKAAGAAAALSILLCNVKQAEPLVAGGVEVVVERHSALFHGAHECPGKWVQRSLLRDVQLAPTP